MATATLGMTQMANAAPPQQGVPNDLVPTSGQVFLVGHAKGVQIYTCNGTDWGKSVPRADLFDDAGKLIVKHSGGPTGPMWTATADGSTVTATAIKKDPVDFDPRLRRTFSSFCCRQRRPHHLAASSAERRSSSGSTPSMGPNLPPPSARRKRPAR